LTGRLGGMVGQLEYAAANEGLTRLGLWAQRRARFPVMTLCWPTWDRLGLISNFAASLRYMAALDVDAGLAAWQAELTAGSSGEVTFVGPLGNAIDPSHATGYPVVPELPGFDRAYPKIFHLGDVREYRPHRFLRSVWTIHRDWSPVLSDFLVAGVEALPVSVLLENAVRGAEWVLPEDLPPLRLRRVEKVVVPLSVLPARGSVVALERVVQGGYVDDHWVLDVTFRRIDEVAGPDIGDPAGGEAEDDQAAARLRLFYGPPGGNAPGPVEGPDPPVTTFQSGPPKLRWRGGVLPLAQWQKSAGHRQLAEVPRSVESDLWVRPWVPSTALPVAPLENILRACTVVDDRLSVATDPVVIGRITMHEPHRGSCQIQGDPALGVWKVTDVASGDPVITVTGLAGPQN
jgi:hypothetical protein